MPIVRGISRFVDVPSTWEGWVMRVMTIAVVLMIVVSLTLLQMVIGLRAYVTDSRQQRTTFQGEETRRQCEILRFEGATIKQLQDLKC